MSYQANSLWNFNVFDFFVNLLPGVVSILLVYLLAPDRFAFVLEFNPFLIVILIILLAYIMGHILQELSTSVEQEYFKISEKHEQNQFKPFDEMIINAYESGRDDVVTKFIGKSEEFFDINLNLTDEESRDRDIFELFMLIRGHLTDIGGNGRVERFQALYLGFLSLSFLFAAGTIVYMVWFFILLSSGASLDRLILYFSLIIVLAIGADLAYDIRLQYHKRLARIMIYDFYSTVLVED